MTKGEHIMNLRKSVIGATAVLFLAMGPAFAGHCPLDAKAIDHALSKVTIDDATRQEVEALRDEGLALHNAGNHKESEDKLSQAMRLLLEAL